VSRVEIIALVVMFAGIFVGLAAAAVLVGRRPAFWGGMVLFVAQRAWPYIKAYITMRDPPEIEAKKVECARRGGEWDNFNKRCRYK
jgi:hypothetical protein